MSFPKIQIVRPAPPGIIEEIHQWEEGEPISKDGTQVKIFFIKRNGELSMYCASVIWTIELVKAKYEAELKNIEGVVGVEIGKCEDKPCLKVYLEKETLESKNIPTSLEGFKVDVEIIGPIKPLEQVKIQTDTNVYTPPRCRTMGIGLTPVYTSNRPRDTLKFRWNTNYGYFSIWDHELGRFKTEVINNGEKIYWSYDLDDKGKEKPPVRISLKIEDASSGELLGEAVLEIEWENMDTAKVKN